MLIRRTIFGSSAFFYLHSAARKSEIYLSRGWNFSLHLCQILRILYAETLFLISQKNLGTLNFRKFYCFEEGYLRNTIHKVNRYFQAELLSI